MVVINNIYQYDFFYLEVGTIKCISFSKLNIYFIVIINRYLL